jgi:hypothetical protein
MTSKSFTFPNVAPKSTRSRKKAKKKAPKDLVLIDLNKDYSSIFFSYMQSVKQTFCINFY